MLPCPAPTKHLQDVESRDTLLINVIEMRSEGEISVKKRHRESCHISALKESTFE